MRGATLSPMPHSDAIIPPQCTLQVRRPEWRRLPLKSPDANRMGRLETANVPGADAVQGTEEGNVELRRLDAYRKPAKEIESGERF